MLSSLYICVFNVFMNVFRESLSVNQSELSGEFPDLLQSRSVISHSSVWCWFSQLVSIELCCQVR